MRLAVFQYFPREMNQFHSPDVILSFLQIRFTDSICSTQFNLSSKAIFECSPRKFDQDDTVNNYREWIRKWGGNEISDSRWKRTDIEKGEPGHVGELTCFLLIRAESVTTFDFSNTAVSRAADSNSNYFTHQIGRTLIKSLLIAINAQTF